MGKKVLEINNKPHDNTQNLYSIDQIMELYEAYRLPLILHIPTKEEVEAGILPNPQNFETTSHTNCRKYETPNCEKKTSQGEVDLFDILDAYGWIIAQ